MKYNIQYSEIYSDVYTVEASNFEKAIEKLQADLLEGCIKGPDICIRSSFEDVTDKHKQRAKHTKVCEKCSMCYYYQTYICSGATEPCKGFN